MAYIDEDGLVQPEPGDVLKVTHLLREHDYGELLGGRPQLLVWHLTGNYLPLGANTAERDGTAGMAQRIAAGTARYYAHGYLGRDGVLHQVVPFTRAAIHVSGKWQGQEINRLSTGIEVTNLGYVRPSGQMPGGHHVDLTRDDLRTHGKLAWQALTAYQLSAILELAVAWRRWTHAAVEDCLRGHADVNPGDGHADPGPELRAFLDGPVRAKLENGG